MVQRLLESRNAREKTFSRPRTRKADLFHHPLRRLSVVVVMQPTQNSTLADSLRAQTDIEFQQFTLHPLHAPEQVIVLHAQDQVLDFCVDRLMQPIVGTWN